MQTDQAHNSPILAPLSNSNASVNLSHLMKTNYTWTVGDKRETKDLAVNLLPFQTRIRGPRAEIIAIIPDNICGKRLYTQIYCEEAYLYLRHGFSFESSGMKQVT